MMNITKLYGLWDKAKYFIFIFAVSIPFSFFPIDDRLTMKTYGFKLGYGLYLSNSPLSENPFFIIYDNGIPLILSLLGWMLVFFIVLRIRKRLKNNKKLSIMVDSLLAMFLTFFVTVFNRNTFILLWDLWTSHSSYESIIHMQSIAVFVYFTILIISLSCLWFYLLYNAHFLLPRARVIYISTFMLLWSAFIYFFMDWVKNDLRSFLKKPTYYKQSVVPSGDRKCGYGALQSWSKSDLSNSLLKLETQLKQKNYENISMRSLQIFMSEYADIKVKYVALLERYKNESTNCLLELGEIYYYGYNGTGKAIKIIVNDKYKIISCRECEVLM